MSDEQAPKSYVVGYGKPPAQSRFRKGQSGNPAGRPKGARAAAQTPDRFAYGMAPTREIIREEAYRPITLREGDKTLTMPSIQAVMRALTMQALKGSRLAQKNWVEIIQRIEEIDFQRSQELFRSALNYKDHWYAEFRRCDSAGIPRPEPVPHPDDMEVDPDTVTVRIRGPKTEESKAKFEKSLEWYSELLDETEDMRRRARRRPKSAELKSLIAQNQELIDTAEEALTERYRRMVREGRFRRG